MTKPPKDPEKPERERDPVLDAVGHKIKVARIQANLTQKEMGTLLGVGQSWVFVAEDGQNNFQVKTLMKIAEVLKVDVKSLLPGDIESAPVHTTATQVAQILQTAIADTTQLLNRLHKASILAEGQISGSDPANR